MGLKYEELSEEARESVEAMVSYCIRNGVGMGMDEGFLDFDTMEEYPFKTELRIFFKEPK